MWIFLLAPAANADSERIFTILKSVKSYLRAAVGSNRLHVLMLMHTDKNAMGNTNLADAANELFEKKNQLNFQTFS